MVTGQGSTVLLEILEDFKVIHELLTLNTLTVCYY